MWRLRPRLHGSGQRFARTKTCTVPPCVHTGPAVLDEFFNGKGPVYTGPDKFMHGQKLARFHLAFTRDRWSWTNFLTAKCASLGPEKSRSTFDQHGSNFVRTGVNTRTVQVFAQFASLGLVNSQSVQSELVVSQQFLC